MLFYFLKLLKHNYLLGIYPISYYLRRGLLMDSSCIRFILVRDLTNSYLLTFIIVRQDIVIVFVLIRLLFLFLSHLSDKPLKFPREEHNT